ncbi:hypothetical protein ANCCAN_12746 [Ancylostoma caninum]|uniref:SCP domain-containing protein n=1 Tax=Ancylostoma caninum TaxID=29170 RepID=A0A368GE37_ANCCA|nr:hypothetical protein ANCCAN_12746 [Ancylostoma caninum]
MITSNMSSLLLLQLVALYLIHVTRADLLAAPGSDPNVEESGNSEEYSGGDRQASSDGQAAIPKCEDGMKQNARERLVRGVKSKNPDLTYKCYLAEQALLELRGSSGGTHHNRASDGTDTGMGSSHGLLFQRPRKDKYPPRRFVGDAVKNWEKDLKDMKSTRFGCGLKQTPAEYLLVCFFE